MGSQRKLFVGFCVVVVLAVAAVAISRLCPSRPAPMRAFRIAKNSWPTWDTFRMAVRERERRGGEYRTEFLQTHDFVRALRLVEEGKADGATLTIYEAIQAAARGCPLKIVLLLDYTVGSDGVVAREEVGSLLELKGRRCGSG
jgi:NitT/TauT family transport system substrate-binding protein